MILHLHSDASYLSKVEARSRAGDIFFLSSPLANPTRAPEPADPPPPTNGALHIFSSIMPMVLFSATEAKLGTLFYNTKDACVLHTTTLSEICHPQPATPIQTDNAVAAGITNDTVKQHRSKAINMQFYWIKDHVKNGEFLIHWRKGIDNVADYFTKHHSPSHHRLMLRSHYLHQSS
jgi:hypothetical protein